MVGFKPTFGVIPRAGVLTQSSTLDTIGVFGRTVEDVALATDALQGYDARDAASLSTSRPRILDTATQAWPLPPLFAFVKTHAWSDADAVMREAFGELIEELGGQVTEISMESATERGVAAARIVQDVEMAAHYGPLLERSPGQFSKELAERIEGGRKVNGVDYFAALDARERVLRQRQRDFHRLRDNSHPGGARPGAQGSRYHRQSGLLRFWTYLGVPAVTLPLLEADGMPMGVQLDRPAAAMTAGFCVTRDGWSEIQVDSV